MRSTPDKLLLITPVVFGVIAAGCTGSGHLSKKGSGSEGEPSVAAAWRAKAEQGDPHAQDLLGKMYEEGEGVEQDYQMAIKWYRLAAEQGDGSAQFNLGRMYERGQGVPQDYLYAHMWIHIAATSSYQKSYFYRVRDVKEIAKEARNRLANQMTPDQRAKAEAMATNCIQKKFKTCTMPKRASMDDKTQVDKETKVVTTKDSAGALSSPPPPRINKAECRRIQSELEEHIRQLNAQTETLAPGKASPWRNGSGACRQDIDCREWTAPNSCQTYLGPVSEQLKDEIIRLKSAYIIGACSSRVAWPRKNCSRRAIRIGTKKTRITCSENRCVWSAKPRTPPDQMPFIGEITCPPGTALFGDAPPKGNRKFCQRKDGTRHGKYIRWHSNGQLHEHAEYKEGKLHGKYIRWYESGVIDLEGEYDNGEKNGTFVTLSMEREYKNGELIRRLIDGIKYQEYRYKDGKQHGRQITRLPNGQELVEMWRDGRRVGPRICWDPSGFEVPCF